jgi:hypothetical protein
MYIYEYTRNVRWYTPSVPRARRAKRRLWDAKVSSAAEASGHWSVVRAKAIMKNPPAFYIMIGLVHKVVLKLAHKIVFDLATIAAGTARWLGASPVDDKL